MTSEDESRLTEEEIDEIVERVVDELGGGDGEHETGPTEEADEVDVDPVSTGSRGAAASDGTTAGRDDTASEREANRARERAERLEERAERLEAHAERGSERLERLGERIEAQVERRLEGLADHIERAIEEPMRRREPGRAPEPGRERAVYKTQLQKGGRIAVPDAEIEALDLEPGDTLQVTLFKVD